LCYLVMINRQHILLPIKFNCNGVGIETKVLKYAYNGEVMYKVALPSSVSATQQCWIAKNEENWRMVMGTATEQAILKDLIAAIKKQEQLQLVYPKAAPAHELKSA